jgi:nitroreductase
MNKSAQNNHPIHILLKDRWSPRAYSAQPVEEAKLLSLFEAARWSPSGGNTQPWAFLLTRRDQPAAHEKLVSALGERNQLWARHAPVLVLSLAKVLRDDGSPNAYAGYDLGQAMAHLSIQAGDLGLHVHQMAGFDQMKARELFAIPAAYQPMTVFTVGYLGDPQTLPDELRERELQPRARKPLAEFVFTDEWGKSITD